LGFIILAAGYNAGRIGLDRWVVPFFKKTSKKGTGHEKAKVSA
ncbi:Crp/Fnr family transcriptional regulator, partial [Bacillus sp. AFS073361]